MIDVYINRDLPTPQQNIGTLTYAGEDNSTGEKFECVTLELAYRENQPDVSCIPIGSYKCKWTRSSRLSKAKGEDVYTYEVLDVPNRSGIRIHSANFFHSLLGCIALGEGYIDLDKDGEADITNSRATVKAFYQLMNKQDFMLHIS